MILRAGCVGCDCHTYHSGTHRAETSYRSGDFRCLGSACHFVMSWVDEKAFLDRCAFQNGLRGNCCVSRENPGFAPVGAVLVFPDVRRYLQYRWFDDRG